MATGLYRARTADDSPVALLHGWIQRLPAGATFGGATAAWLHGLKLDPINPIEIVIGSEKGVRSRPGLSVRRRLFASDDVVTVRGLPATSLYRTLMDICLWRPAVEALVALDMAVEQRQIDVGAVIDYANSMRGRAGSARLRELVKIAAPAESPMETRLRWHFLSSGLPKPEVQVDLYDGRGVVIARADLYYPAAKLVIEFDGMNHKERLISDDRRQNLIVNAGYRLLRFTTADLRDRPDVIVLQVRAALAAASESRPLIHPSH